jgi:hypothetical protein
MTFHSAIKQTPHPLDHRTASSSNSLSVSLLLALLFYKNPRAPSSSLHLYISPLCFGLLQPKKKNCRTRALLLQNFPAASSLGLVHKSSTFSYLFTHQDIEGSQKKSLTLPLFVCYGFVVKQSMQLCFTFLLV